MAQLNFKGKSFVQNHHLLVKYHSLNPVILCAGKISAFLLVEKAEIQTVRSIFAAKR
ncbi:MAG: hypothetical protein V1899_03340 [Planctomycetota bacterium]